MTGNNLSSQAASSPVLSTRESLTAVFGMGTGGASQPSSPDLWMVFFAFCHVSLRLTRSIYASIISRRSPCLPRIIPENPHSSFRSSQTFKTLQKKLLTFNLSSLAISNQALDGLVPVRSIHYCTYTPGLSTLSSSRRLTDFRHERSHLGVGFTLRCFQRLSDPDVATQRYAWRHNWYTIGPSTPVLSY